MSNNFKNVARSYSMQNKNDYWASNELGVENAMTISPSFSWSNWEKKKYYKVMCTHSIENLNFNNLLKKTIKKRLLQIKKPLNNLNVKKDMFETTDEFNTRVEKIKIKQFNRIENYNNKIIAKKMKILKDSLKYTLEVKWGKPMLKNLQYDADNNLFIANLNFENRKDFNKKVAIKIKRKYAKDFYENIKNINIMAVFNYDKKSINLKEINIPYNNQMHSALFTDINILETQIAINLNNKLINDMNINTNIEVSKTNINTFNTSNLKDFKELDRLLNKSYSTNKDNKKWLFIVGIEQYEFTDNISYASRSAKMFKKVMKKKLGIKESNCFTMLNQNATSTKIKTNLKKMLRKIKKGDTIYFYYNGHGVPVPSLKYEPYMLTVDTEPDYIADESFFSLKNIYGKLSASKAKKIVAIVDSCFSGVTDGKSILKGVAATKMKSRSVNFDKEKMVVMSAGKGHQYSNGYNKKGHRLFSFFIMKNIIQGDIKIKELYKNTKKETYNTSLEEYGDLRVQEPTIDGNFRMSL